MSSVSLLTDGRRELCHHCEVADTALRRVRGLLGRTGLDRGEAMLLRPAPSIHTCFMKFPIDAVFVDRDLRVVGVSEQIPPWRFARARGAHSAIELAAGECRRLGIVTGDRLLLTERGTPAPAVSA